MTYNEALEYIHSVKWQGHKPGLQRTQELLRALGNPEKTLKFVHVAGTNGKGSTCAMLANVLKNANYRTGLYTSPFIHRFNDRMQINGAPIADEELAQLTEEVRVVAEKMVDLPTEFEMITALGMLYFSRNKCDIVVLEVGLGGALDSTNVIESPEVCVITSLGLDHTAELGTNIADIASAKAGIIKKGTEVVFYGAEKQASDVIEKTCQEQDVKLNYVDFESLNIKERSLKGFEFAYKNHENLFLPLLGTYQPYNAATVLCVIEVLQKKGWNISQKAIKQGLENVQWGGRFELLLETPPFILDGSHNVHGLLATVESLKSHFPDTKFNFILSVMADKNYTEMLDILCPLADKIFAVRANIPRALDEKTLAQEIEKRKVETLPCASIENAVKTALAENKITCALGTLYFSEDIRQAVLRYKGA